MATHAGQLVLLVHTMLHLLVVVDRVIHHVSLVVVLPHGVTIVLRATSDSDSDVW